MTLTYVQTFDFNQEMTDAQVELFVNDLINMVNKSVTNRIINYILDNIFRLGDVQTTSQTNCRKILKKIGPDYIQNQYMKSKEFELNM